MGCLWVITEGQNDSLTYLTAHHVQYFSVIEFIKGKSANSLGFLKITGWKWRNSLDNNRLWNDKNRGKECNRRRIK